MGTPYIPPDSTAVIRYNDAANEPGISDAERIRRKRRDLGKLDAALLAPDAADESVQQQGAARVRGIRKGSRRDSFLGNLDFGMPAPGSSSLLGDV